MLELRTGIYTRCSDEFMNSDVKRVLDNIEQNGKFPKLAQDGKDVRTLYDTYSESYRLAGTRSSEAVKQKKIDKKLLSEGMQLFIVKLNADALGDLEKLSSTGVKMVKQRGEEKRVKLTKPKGVTAQNWKNSGCVKLSVEDAGGANSVMYQYSLTEPKDGAIWESESKKGKFFVFTNLPVGKRVWFRVKTSGSYDQSMCSDVISIIITD